jgi:hypothetical protein
VTNDYINTDCSAWCFSGHMPHGYWCCPSSGSLPRFPCFLLLSLKHVYFQYAQCFVSGSEEAFLHCTWNGYGPVKWKLINYCKTTWRFMHILTQRWFIHSTHCSFILWILGRLLSLNINSTTVARLTFWWMILLLWAEKKLCSLKAVSSTLYFVLSFLSFVSKRSFYRERVF